MSPDANHAPSRPTFAITVQRVFAAAHAIRLPDGSLEPIHGHNWNVEATVTAPSLDEIETVMDFHVLEQLMDAILKPMHNRHLNELEPFIDTKVNPTAERVAWHIAKQLMAGLPEHVSLESVTVSEAPGCIAAYRP